MHEYKDAQSKTVVQTFLIPDMEHGIAIAPAQACGEAADYLPDVGICAVRMVGYFWGLNANQ